MAAAYDIPHFIKPKGKNIIGIPDSCIINRIGGKASNEPSDIF
ncbi:hypothetical protein C1G86_0265 [Dehalococcoides mccartyi]|uniref:Uncharacterized protein n=1 Tax=Dehalococcoides mccartyi TaxID=61435 RepID=A0A328EPS5_9CHLR|nr:hypothetical protein C1G86_0265 [Dehalococcoides mccartyi]